MKNKVNDIPEDDFLIEMTDEDGNTFYYVEEMIIPVGEENFALLVEVKPEDDDDECECHHEHKHGHGCCHDDEECNHEHKHKHDGCCHDEDECDCGCDEDDVIIAKIVVNEDGEEEYVEPTDEEFELVQQAYEKLMDEEE